MQNQLLIYYGSEVTDFTLRLSLIWSGRLLYLYDTSAIEGKH